MASKRNAASELNHDNWDDDYETEEAGTFKRASEDVIQKRVIKTARRRNPASSEEKSTTNVFSSFGGFKKTTTQDSASPFAFLSNLANSQNNTNSSSTSVTSTNSSSLCKVVENSTNNKTEPEKSATYFAKLQGLNESVSEWIKTHVEKNPYCILTPIFKDYEKYLSEIESLKENEQNTFKFPTDSKNFVPSTVSKAFGNSKTNENPFSSKPEVKETSTTSIFGNNQTSNFNFEKPAPFTFTNVAKPETDEKKSEEAEDEDEPPKIEFKAVVEEGNVFSKRCKVFVKKDDAFVDRGVGQLFLKPVEGKIQLIVRQDTSLGNLLLNIILSKSVPTQRMGKNNVMMVCVPDEKSKPPPVPVLLRVKTAEEADELLSVLEKHKN